MEQLVEIDQMCMVLDFGLCVPSFMFFFFFNDTATTEIYTLSLHDALPISGKIDGYALARTHRTNELGRSDLIRDRKSTRLNSSHVEISYAVFCLKKKKLNGPISTIYLDDEALI